jgi:hypothetical protein
MMTRDEVARRLKFHRCQVAHDAGFRVYFNDWGVKIDGLPGVTKGCPFCWRSYFDFRREWDRVWYAHRAVATPEEAAAAVVDVVRRLERPNFPENGIVNHFGPCVSVNGLGINVATRGSHYLVTMYQTMHYRPAKLHLARAEAVAASLTTSIQDQWNGKDGSEGISIVLSRFASGALQTALENYRKMGFRCFKPSNADKDGYAAFREWYEAPL